MHQGVVAISWNALVVHPIVSPTVRPIVCPMWWSRALSCGPVPLNAPVACPIKSNAAQVVYPIVRPIGIITSIESNRVSNAAVVRPIVCPVLWTGRGYEFS